jgi:hypothetical protein
MSPVIGYFATGRDCVLISDMTLLIIAESCREIRAVENWLFEAMVSSRVLAYSTAIGVNCKNLFFTDFGYRVLPSSSRIANTPQ